MILEASVVNPHPATGYGIKDGAAVSIRMLAPSGVRDEIVKPLDQSPQRAASHSYSLRYEMGFVCQSGAVLADLTSDDAPQFRVMLKGSSLLLMRPSLREVRHDRTQHLQR